MLLKNLIKNSPKNIKELKIKGLALNSKDVKKGFIFFAIKGTKFNGENYINKAGGLRFPEDFHPVDLTPRKFNPSTSYYSKINLDLLLLQHVIYTLK